MSSAYAPQPFSYLAGGAQPPKTGFRRDDGLYASRGRRDMAQPIPALRHDQPRLAGDWSIEQRLRGGGADSTATKSVSSTPGERRRATPHESTADTESVLSSNNMRLPRPDVSLYQSQIARPVVADTPSGHYSNDVDDTDRVVAAKPPSHAGSVFDNFILKGPGVLQAARSDGGGAARREDDERSRLEQLFDDPQSSSSELGRSSSGARVSTDAGTGTGGGGGGGGGDAELARRDETSHTPSATRSVTCTVCTAHSRPTQLNCCALTAALQPISFVTLTRVTNNASYNWVSLVQVRSVQFSSPAVNSPSHWKACVQNWSSGQFSSYQFNSVRLL